MRLNTESICGCFPTGRHYPGIADKLAELKTVVAGLAEGFDAQTIWSEAPLAVVDFETTGLNPETDRIIEVGIVCFADGALRQKLNWLVNPGIRVPEESRAVHQISEEELAAAPPLASVFPKVLEALAGHLPVAYNADFDRRFLHREAAPLIKHLSELPPALDAQVAWVDPLVWTRELFREQKSRKLVDVAEALGVQLGQAHRAADDAETTGHVLLALAEQLPRTYGELIRLQGNYASRQEADRLLWRKN